MVSTGSNDFDLWIGTGFMSTKSVSPKWRVRNGSDFIRKEHSFPIYRKGRGPSIFGDMITLSFFDQSMGVPSTGDPKKILQSYSTNKSPFRHQGPCVKVTQYHIVIRFVRVAVPLMRGSKGSKILNLGNSEVLQVATKPIQVEWISWIVLLENDKSYRNIGIWRCVRCFLWVIWTWKKHTWTKDM